MKKAASERKSANIKMSKTKIEKTIQHGGNIVSILLGLATPLIKPAIKVLSITGLNFGAEKALKKISATVTGQTKWSFSNLFKRCHLNKKKC